MYKMDDEKNHGTYIIQLSDQVSITCTRTEPYRTLRNDISPDRKRKLNDRKQDCFHAPYHRVRVILEISWMEGKAYSTSTKPETCILLWILYGNMVDFSFIVSLYVSDLPNVTISTKPETRRETISLQSILQRIWP